MHCIVAVCAAVAEMRATSEELALRQSDSLAVSAQELFCSPDIIRQVGKDSCCGTVVMGGRKGVTDRL